MAPKLVHTVQQYVCIISLLPFFELSLLGVKAVMVVSLCETLLKIHLCVGEYNKLR